MSWIEKIQSDFKITCGDGSIYTPLWLNASKGIEYNTTQLEFPRLSGSLILRGTPKGTQYNIELYFQGDDHLDVSAAFEKSSADPGAWTIEHPLYGSLYVQPISMVFDNAVMNVTKITGSVIETIREDAPKSTISAQDKIAALSSQTCDSLATTYTETVPDVKVSDTIAMKKGVLDTYNSGVKGLKTTLNAEAYYNAFNTANSAIDSLLSAASEPLEVMGEIKSLINYPVNFADTIENRLKLMAGQYAGMAAGIVNTVSKSIKKLFEHNAGTLISAMALATVTNAVYKNRGAALGVMQTIIANHNSYLTMLDSLQGLNGGNPINYIPDYYALNLLSQTVNEAVQNLITITQNAKQERSIYLEDDSNIVLLTHRFYGLDIADENINAFINDNGIGFDEYWEVKKGRKIIYYV